MIWHLRNAIRDGTESLYLSVRSWLEKYRWIGYLYAVFAWFSVLMLLYSLFAIQESRTMLLQYAWSTYVLLQFWVLCRSKTITWRAYSLFVLAGIVGVVPLTAFTVNSFHAVFGGTPDSTWSVAVLTPILEELWKLLPLGVFLLFSRRGSALSLSDYTLIGAASGAGFQLMEEMTRRWITSSSMYGQTLLGGKVIHWDIWSLFTGQFEESYSPTLLMVGHPVHTALIALGCGLAMRLRKVSYASWAIPLVLLLWAILNHMAWNGQGRLPDWVFTIHGWTGSGYWTKPFFLLLLVIALMYDYWGLNRVRGKLPAIPKEGFLHPLSEWWRITDALLTDRGRFVYWMDFYRERRKLGFLLLYGNEETKRHGEELHSRVNEILRAVTGAAVLLLLVAGAALLPAASPSVDGSCFSCMFDSLQNWWDRLEWYEQLGLVLGALALAMLFVGFWPALGIAMTLASIAGSGHEIAAYIRDPRKLLTPANALSVAVGVVLSRIPFGRAVGWMARKAGAYAGRLFQRLFRRVPKPDVPRPHGPQPKPPHTRGEGPEPEPNKPNDGTGPVPPRKSYREVEIVDKTGKPVGEFDEIDLERKIFYEDKTAKGLDRVNPRTGRPTQTPQQFTDKQLYEKTRNRIENLKEAAATRATASGSKEVPSLDEIRSIREFTFRLDGDTPELRAAAENSLNRLRQEYPDYTFNILFGGKP